MSSVGYHPTLPEMFAAHLRHLYPEETARLQAETSEPATLDDLRRDPANFFRLAGMTPDPWQESLFRSDSRRILLLCNRQAGKSTTAAKLALAEALLRPPALVLLLSPSLRQSAELFRKVADSFSALSRPAEVAFESVLRIEFANGSRILSLPADEKNIRGFSGAAMLVIDEAARVEDSLYYSVRPMLAVSGGKLVALSTPYGRRGWFYQEWQGENAWERVRVTADQCPRIPKAFLEEERRTLGDAWFNQEYMCDFEAGSGRPLFPGEWLDRAAQVAAALPVQRKAEAIGCDPGEGEANSSWVVGDRYGILEVLSMKTPNTTEIPATTLMLMRKWNVPPEKVAMDRGGGGKQHADYLETHASVKITTVAFGEAPSIDPRQWLTPAEERVQMKHEKYAFVNRRAEMYWRLRAKLDPALNPKGYGIPAVYTNLRSELAPIPMQSGQWSCWDAEGRFRMPPKNKKRPDSEEVTLTELIGHSPDEADACVLMLHALESEGAVVYAGVK